jgi:hypothetical protein
MVGCSLAVGPQGIIAQGLYNEFASHIEWLTVEIPQRDILGTDIGKRLKELNQLI